MIKCKDCEHCVFNESKNGRSIYFCRHAKSPSVLARTAGQTEICRTERRSTEFTIKKTPKWCPLNIEKEEQEGKR
ncbi:MAG: hypothetical protein E7345_01445 [Clostridiales bacterium]|nr:hypothetical protein [Clostridiales bacterium]